MSKNFRVNNVIILIVILTFVFLYQVRGVLTRLHHLLMGIQVWGAVLHHLLVDNKTKCWMKILILLFYS